MTAALSEIIERVEGERDYDAEMRLPKGQSCSDCAHFRRCSTMFGHEATDTTCDWAPSKFRARLATQEQQG